MPRSFVLCEKLAGLALVLLIGTSHAALLRAEQPRNSLRPVSSLPSTLRITPVPADPQLGWVATNAEDPATSEPPSIVPPQLGQPELLPTPAGSSLRPGEYFGEPDFSCGAPWQQQVHPLFEEPWFAHGDPNDPRR